MKAITVLWVLGFLVGSQAMAGDAELAYKDGQGVGYSVRCSPR